MCKARALPGNIHIRRDPPGDGSLPGQQVLQMLVIVAFIAHREGWAASE